MTRSPIKRKRSKPRRGRVTNAEFMAFVRKRGCILRSKHTCHGIVTFHHIRTCGSPKDDTRGIGLCCAGHLQAWSAWSIEQLGKLAFEAHWDINLEDEIKKNWDAYASIR